MAVQANSRIFSDEDEAIVEMGVGKNMVRSIRFWAAAAGIIKTDGNGGYAITEFGDTLFGDCGLNPFIEDIQTLLLLHWKLANANDPPHPCLGLSAEPMARTRDCQIGCSEFVGKGSRKDGYKAVFHNPP